MVSDSALRGGTVWVFSGLLLATAGSIVADALTGVPLLGEGIATIVWLAAHLYAVKLGLQGVAIVVEDIVVAELDRRD